MLVLGIFWDETLTDRPHLGPDTKRLLSVFETKFGYKTATHILRSEDTYKDLNRRLVNLDVELGSKTEENLLILYYAGHSCFDGDDSKARLWSAGLADGARTVDWNKLQTQLAESDFDIFFLFDCCYAMAMPNEKLMWRRRCEIVGSSGPREKAGGRPETSFTAAVTELLEDDLEKLGETNVFRLGVVMKSRNYKRLLKSKPDYKALADGHPTIPLVPMNKKSTTSDTTLVDMLTCSDFVQRCYIQLAEGR